MNRARARSWSTAPTCARPISARCAPRSPSSATRASSSRRRSPRTSPARAPRRAGRRSKRLPAAPRPTASSPSWRTATTPSSATGGRALFRPGREARRAGARPALARALLPDPRVLILDDAPSSVDAGTEAAIKDGLREAMAGRTTFVIAHRLSTVSLADEVVVMGAGSIGDRRAWPRRLGLPAARPRAARGAGETVRRFWRMIRGEDQRGRKLRWMAGLLRPYRGRGALTLPSIPLPTPPAPAPPHPPRPATDAATPPEDTGALTLIVLAFVAVAVIYAAATYAQTYLVGWVGTRALQDLRERIFAHIQSMSIGFFTRLSPGVLISRMTNDVEALNQLVTSGVVTLLSSGLTLIGVVAIMLFLDRKLALVTFITFPLLAIASVVFRIVSHGAYRLTRERIAAVTAYLQETLSGVRVVRSFGQEPRHAAARDELNEANREANMKTVYLNATYFPAVELLSAVGTAAIVLYGGTQVIDNALQVGV